MLKVIGGPGKDKSGAMTVAANGDIVVFGTLDKASLNKDQTLPTVARFSTNGNLVWQKIISLETNFSQDCKYVKIEAKAIAATVDDGFVLLANMVSEKNFFNQLDIAQRILFIKLNGAGEIQVMREIGYDPESHVAVGGDIRTDCSTYSQREMTIQVNGEEIDVEASSLPLLGGGIVATPDGGALFSASILGINDGNFSMLLVKLAADGTVDHTIIDPTSGGEGAEYFAIDLEPLSDGKFAVLGKWGNWQGEVLASRSELWLLSENVDTIAKVQLPEGLSILVRDQTLGIAQEHANVNHGIQAHEGGFTLTEIIEGGGGSQAEGTLSGDSVRIWEFDNNLQLLNQIAVRLDMHTFPKSYEDPVPAYVAKIPNNGYVVTATDISGKIIGIRISETGDRSMVEEFGSNSGPNTAGPVLVNEQGEIWITGTIFFQGNDMISLIRAEEWL